jgi:cation:H+ antiporter
MRGAASSGLKVLISSKVNQWTLLVGTIPLVFAISGGAVRPFVLDNLQNHELLLTAAQSLFGVAVLVNLRLSRSNGLLLVVLFTSQLIFANIRMEVAAIYILLAVIYHVKRWRCLIPAARIGLGMKKE